MLYKTNCQCNNKQIMKTIFAFDDSDMNLTKAKQALTGHYRVLTMPSAERMFALLEKITPNLILLDIEMPGMDGFTALKKLMEEEKTAKIPVMFLTASTDEEVEARGFELGAVDFVSKPFSTSVLLNRIATHLHIDEIIKKRTARIEQLQNGIILVTAAIVENRDKLTGGHIERTSLYLKLMIDEMLTKGVYVEEIKDWDVDVLVSSARLHDVGKIEISDLILNKPDKLTPDELERMRSHTLEGERIIDQVIVKTGEGWFLHHARLFAGYHHERWDGGGYPHGLKNERIPLQGRIMAVADVYDALISERPYKKAFPRADAERIILNDNGAAFDPNLVEVFLELKDAFAEVVESYRSI